MRSDCNRAECRPGKWLDLTLNQPFPWAGLMSVALAMALVAALARAFLMSGNVANHFSLLEFCAIVLVGIVAANTSFKHLFNVQMNERVAASSRAD